MVSQVLTRLSFSCLLNSYPAGISNFSSIFPVRAVRAVRAGTYRVRFQTRLSSSDPRTKMARDDRDILPDKSATSNQQWLLVSNE